MPSAPHSLQWPVELWASHLYLCCPLQGSLGPCSPLWVKALSDMVPAPVRHGMCPRCCLTSLVTLMNRVLQLARLSQGAKARGHLLPWCPLWWCCRHVQQAVSQDKRPQPGSPWQASGGDMGHIQVTGTSPELCGQRSWRKSPLLCPPLFLFPLRCPGSLPGRSQPLAIGAFANLGAEGALGWALVLTVQGSHGHMAG